MIESEKYAIHKGLMMHKFGFAIVGFSLVLSGCVADMRMENAITERGAIATRGVELGQVYLWTPSQHSIVPAAVIEPVGNRYLRQGQANPGSQIAKLDSHVEFMGGMNISRAEEKSLETEVSNRSQVQFSNSVVISFSAPLPALRDAIRGNPNLWLPALEIDDGFPDDPDETYIVLAHQQTLGDRLSVSIDNSTAAGVTFKSNTVRIGGANVRFKIIDASTLTLEHSSEGRIPIFVGLVVFRMTENATGSPQFRTVKDSGLMAELVADLQSGN